MAYLAIPLKVVKTGLAREDNIKHSIDEALSMLLTTPRYIICVLRSSTSMKV